MEKTGSFPLFPYRHLYDSLKMDLSTLYPCGKLAKPKCVSCPFSAPKPLAKTAGKGGVRFIVYRFYYKLKWKYGQGVGYKKRGENRAASGQETESAYPCADAPSIRCFAWRDQYKYSKIRSIFIHINKSNIEMKLYNML
ncbi:MAG: hypothetical protein II871_03570 [Clostridia bacterium]|nr:hypothetical protein [Clostridia bacterium]